MPTLKASLSEALESPGVVGAALVDAVTGLAYAAAGGYRVNGSEIAELTNLVVDWLYEAGTEGDLESVVMTGGTVHEVVRTVPGRGRSDGLLLFLALDRERTNLALALRQADDLAVGVLA